MAFLDDFSKKLTTAADLAVDKAKDLAETGKLKLDIATEEKAVGRQKKEEISNTYSDLEKVWSRYNIFGKTEDE